MQRASGPGTSRVHDAVVVGAGFGGLGAALTLAERGASVLVLEAMTYPGGCASTFERGGVRYEAGATLFGGFGEGQLFRRWIDRHGIGIEFRTLDPVIELRAPGIRLALTPRRDELVESLCALPDAPERGVREFFAVQARAADALWPALDDPSLLPPFGRGAVSRHLRALPSYLRLAPLAGRTLGDVMRARGVASFEPLRVLVESLCRITVQCGADEAEAPLALAAIDYPFRGAGHVTGGIGEFASGIVGAIRANGGHVEFATRADSIAPCDDGWAVGTRRGTFRARSVLANVLPQDLRRLVAAREGDLPRIDRLARGVESGWGAAMLYLTARAPRGAGGEARHFEIVQDAASPFVAGNHLFCSVSAAGDLRGLPPGRRTITVSTHVPMREFAALSPAAQELFVETVQERMRRGVARFLPEWHEGVESSMTASPRTFARFTGRAGGHVGGVPRTAGVRSYLGASPCEVRPGLFLVGDSVFPGQSALAAAAGGVKAAEAAIRAQGRRTKGEGRTDGGERDERETPQAEACARGSGGARGGAAHAVRRRGVRVHAEG